MTNKEKKIFNKLEKLWEKTPELLKDLVIILIGGVIGLALYFSGYGFMERFDIDINREHQADYKCPADYDTKEEYVDSISRYTDEALENNPSITVTELSKKRMDWFISMGCEKGHWADTGGYETDTDMNKIMGAVKEIESEQPARITGNETMEEIYNNPYIKHIRTALNGYLDGSNTGAEEAIMMGEDDNSDECGLDMVDKSYYESKFFLYDAHDNDYGGVQAYIVFVDKPDTIFGAWVYKVGVEDEYSLRNFCKTGPPEERRAEFTKIMQSFIESGEMKFSL